MATWVMLASVSQSAKTSRSRVMVPNVLSSIIPSASWPVGSGIMRQAVILFFWTSKPAHRVNTTSILHLHALKGLAGYPERERLPCVLHFPGGSWQQFVVPAGIQVQFCHRLGAPIRTRPHTQSFGGHSIVFLGQGIEPAYFHGSWCPAGHESSVASFRLRRFVVWSPLQPMLQRRRETMAISFKGAHFPQDIILMGVRWYVAYPL